MSSLVSSRTKDVPLFDWNVIGQPCLAIHVLVRWSHVSSAEESYAGHGLCIIRKKIYHEQDLIVTTVCHTYLLVINLYHLVVFRQFDRHSGNLSFLGFLTC